MSTLGMVLAGGAARGAYEAGVLRYLFTELPRNLGYVPWPDVVSGCSVGSLNGVFAAARSIEGIHHLSGMWRGLTIDQVYRLHGNSVFGAVKRMLYPTGGASVLDATPLVRLVTSQIPLRDLRDAIDSGRTRALIVSSTSVRTGFNVLFADSAWPHLDLQPMPGTRVQRVRTKAKHLLASCALPLLFPPILIGGELHVDGGLRQNTPLRPTIYSGADRILVLGVHLSKADEANANQTAVVPSLPFLAGKSLNALTLDPIERDIRQAEKVSEIVAWGVKRYGPDFATDIQRDLGLHPVKVRYLKPSEDLGRLAATAWRERPPKVTGQLGWLLSAVADRVNEAGGESDLLSYVYFDKGFTSALEELGFADARRQEEGLVDFLTDSGRLGPPA